MKIQVDGVDVAEITDHMRKVICNDIPKEIVDEDMKRRVAYFPLHKYDQCMKRLRKDWEPKIRAEGTDIPASDEVFANMVFARQDYLDRSARDALEKQKLEELQNATR